MSQPSSSEPVEILRVALAGEEWHYHIGADIFEDPANWGSILADIARQIAEMLAEEEGRDRLATLKGIVDTFAGDIDKDFPGAAE